MKLITLLSCFFILFSFQTTKASHGMGGEITWRCLPNGQFVFTMNFYRDCQGISCPGGPLNLIVSNHPTVTSIQLTSSYNEDLTPQGCGSCANPGPGSVQKCVYESAPLTLAGTPPDSGWVFDWYSCCRSTSLGNIMN
ncbi:MAG: hypothetical protein HKN75_07175, partial [Bacteroidia bacterium]|nr:hypothetical protein [Bacteroidia bacterium]